MGLEEKLKSLNITLAASSGPYGSYVPAKRVGNLIYVSGQIPFKDGKLVATGSVPSRCGIDQAKVAARQCVINALSAIKGVEGRVDHLAGVVRVGAFIHSDDLFTEQATIANSASELLVEIFGEPGRHARIAIGVNTLPRDAAVEIEFIFEVR